MAELVNRHMESMSDETQEMRRIGLYNTEEIKLIMKARKDHEFKINGVSKNLQDLKNYIMFEKALLGQIQDRRDKTKITVRKDEIEYKIFKRIKNLYEVAMLRFSAEFPLYMQYFTFCHQSKYNRGAVNALQNMLKNFPHNPDVWKTAAHWYAYDQKDLKSASTTLDKGLTLHKSSQLLYTEAIKLQLSIINNLNGDCSDAKERDIKIVCQKLETYVNFIFESIDDSKYFIEVLGLFEKYNCTMPVQNAILKKLSEKYCDKEFLWHTLAEREMRGLHFGQKNEDDPLIACFKVYQLGLTKVQGAEKETLWEKYLECLIAIQRKNNEMTGPLKAALQQASEEKFLKDKYFIIWLELVTDEEAHEILTNGTRDLPQSIDLWKLRLRYATMTDKISEVDKVFKEGKLALKEKALPLWLMYLRYYCLLSRDATIESTYQSGVQEPKEIAQVLKPRYLEWLALTKGINEARKVYTELANRKPYCKELHSTMSKLESAEISYDLDAWAKVNKLACLQFGKEDVDVWINHIMFYLHFNKIERTKKVEEIRNEAENVLNPLLISDFREKYASFFGKEPDKQKN